MFNDLNGQPYSNEGAHNAQLELPQSHPGAAYPQSISEFLEFIHPGQRTLLAAINPKTEDVKGESFIDHGEAELWVMNFNNVGWNVYFTVNLTPKRNGRASKTDISHAVACWADVDPDVTTYKSYEAARRQLLNEYLDELKTVKPTLIINSGHGLQPLFLLNEPDPIDAAYEQLNERVGKLLQGPSTFDCNRPLRLPFTLNYPNAKKLKKGYPAEAVQADIIDFTGRRYSKDELRNLLDSKINSKLADVFGQNPKARARWEGSTEGLKDTSGSGMDMSMTAFLKQVGFSREEVEETLNDWPHGSEEGRKQGVRYWDRMCEKCDAPEAKKKSKKGAPKPKLTWAVELLREHYGSH